MDQNEVSTLAVYNSERARGLVHQPEWVARMAELQRRFDWEQLARLWKEADRHDHVVYELPGGGWMVCPPMEPVPDGWKQVKR